MAEAPVDAGGSAAGGTSMVLDVAKAAIGAYGALYSGKSQSNMYNYQAQVARQEAAAASAMAQQDRMAGEVQAQRSGLVGAAQMARTNVRAGAGNVSLTAGSTAAVRSSELAVTQENQRIDRYNAARQAYGEEFMAARYTAQAGVDVTAAETAKTASKIDALSSVVGGASSVADKWYQSSLYAPPPTMGG